MTSRPNLKVITEQNVEEVFVEVTIKRAKVQFYDDVQDDEVFQVILSTCNSATLDSLNCPKRLMQRARTIASNIFDMSTIPSGFISKDCIRVLRTRKKTRKTPEHFHGRQECGLTILEYVKSQIESESPLNVFTIKEMVDKYRQVHFTSADENTRLGTRAKQFPKEDWKDRYTFCGVELIPYIPRKHASTYDID